MKKLVFLIVLLSQLKPFSMAFSVCRQNQAKLTTTTTTTTRLYLSWQLSGIDGYANGREFQEQCDPSAVEFENSETVNQKLGRGMNEFSDDGSHDNVNRESLDGAGAPYALMMQVSAPYIAAHANKIAVFHIPGSLLQDDPRAANHLLSDIHMSWMLGMRIVLVLGSSQDWDVCDVDASAEKSSPRSASPYALRHCYPARRNPHVSATAPPVATNEETLRLLEEEAGFLRTEVERKLNRYVQRTHIGGSRRLGGNVVSGNFYTATRLRLRSQDVSDMVDDDNDQYTGYASDIHVDKIQRILQDHNDVVLLTTVGQSRRGTVVNVNGHQLTAAVAASMQAYKVIYMSSEGCVLQQRQDDTDSRRFIQELSLSTAQSITDYHGVHVRRGKFATIHQENYDDEEDDDNDSTLEPRAIELLLNLAWSSWAVENGVTRAHIVNPTNGALLEELFTSKNGANTCLYHDNELTSTGDEDDELDDFDEDTEEMMLWGDDDEASPVSSTTSQMNSAKAFLEELQRKRRAKFDNSSDSFQ